MPINQTDLITLTLISFWLGALASFVGSLVLVVLLFIFAKPKFKISKEIAYLNTEEYGADIQGSYLIKISNRSLFVSYDITANLEKLNTYHVNGGSNNRSFDLDLVDSNTNYLAGRNIFKNDGKNAFLFRTTEDLSKILKSSDSKLRFTLIARNGFSGLTKIFRQEYNIRGAIKSGHFGFGRDFAIK